MEVLKATPVDDLSDDETYQFTVELMELEKIMISVFNTQTGITFKTYIDKEGEWFKSNIYIFHADFSKALTILKDSLLNNVRILPHVEKEIKGILTIKINYDDAMYPFQLTIEIPKYVSKNGPLEDRIVSLEYQVNKLKLTQIKKKQVSDEVLNEVGNLIYKGEMKDGKRHGKGIEYSPNIKGGVIYEGEFVDGYYEGEGVLNLVSSNILSRNILIKNQNSYTGTFKNGVFHGLIKHIAPWKQSEVNYKDGIQHGSFKSFNEQGYVTHDNTYNDGKLEGLSTSYTGGTLTKAPWKQLEINFKNGKEHGTYKQYEEQGGVIHDHTYNEGIQVG
jgi:antitoxin component YwqK of YwqJK toxin-antitoxin module